MSEKSIYSNLTEATGIFHSTQYLQVADDDLPIENFDLMDLNMLISKMRIEEELRKALIPGQLLENPIEVSKTALFSAVPATGLWDAGDFIKAIMASIIGIKHAMEIEKHRITKKLLWWVHSTDEKQKKHTPGILPGQYCESVYLRILRSLLTTGYRLVTERALATMTAKTANT